MKALSAFAWVICSVLLLSPAGSTAQWQQTNGPFGGDIRALAVSGMNTFAGTAGSGVFLSIDNGLTWREVNTGLANKEVRSLAFSGSKLFAGTDDGIFVTSDNGASWVESDSGITGSQRYIRGIAASGTTLFAAGAYGLYRSLNNGANWTDITHGFPTSIFQAVAVRGTKIYVGTVDWGVFVSTDNGDTWTSMNNGLSGSSVTVNAFALMGTDIFMATNGGTFVLLNNSETWQGTSPGIQNYTARALVVAGTTIYAGTLGGVFRSSNKGATWEPTGMTSGNILALALAGSNLIAGIYGHGVYVSADAGLSWVRTGLNVVDIQLLNVIGHDIFAAVDYSGMWRSSNDGASWSPVTTGLGTIGVVEATAVAGTDLFACVTSSGVYLTSDRGEHWRERDTGLTHKDVNSIAVSGSHLWAGTLHSGVYHSTDYGDHWTVVDFFSSLPYIKFVAASGSVVLVGQDGIGNVFRSTDSGVSWQRDTTGLYNQLVVNVFNAEGTLFATTERGGNFRSTDLGESWKLVAGLPIAMMRSLAIAGTRLFAVVNRGLYVSDDNGCSWNVVKTEFGDKILFSVAVTSTDLFAGTLGGSVWRLPLSSITQADQAADESPRSFRLDQNFPNPFNPSTTISFTISSRSRVSLKIYDVMGRDVATLASEEMPAGNYSRQWNASGYPSGVYFYRLQAGNFTATKRLVLVK